MKLKLKKKECSVCFRLFDPRGLPLHEKTHGKGKKASRAKTVTRTLTPVREETVMIAIDRKLIEEIIFSKISGKD